VLENHFVTKSEHDMNKLQLQCQNDCIGLYSSAEFIAVISIYFNFF